MKATYFVAVFASVAAAAAAEMQSAEMHNANIQNAEVYARQADAAGAADAGGVTFGSLLKTLDKAVKALGEEVPELKEPAKKLTDAIADFSEVAKDVDPESIIKKAGAK